MNADCRVDVIQKPFVHDPPAAKGLRLFCGLEDDPYRAAEGLFLSLQQDTRRIAHCGMGIMAAGMHDAWALGAERHAGGFRDRQRVNIRPDDDLAVRRPCRADDVTARPKPATGLMPLNPASSSTDIR